MRVFNWIVFGACCLPVAAQSLDALVDEAVRNNREILAAQKRYEAARQRPSRESSLPDPMVSLGYSSTGSPRPFAGIGVEPMANAGFMVSQEVPAPGKLKLRGEIAEREADAGWQQYRAVRLDVVARLKVAYHTLHHDFEAARIIRRNQDVLQNIMRVTEARYSVGRAQQQDIFRAQTQLAIMETQVMRLEQDKLSREAEINSLLNRPPGGKIEVPEEMAPGEMRVTLEELYARARTDAPTLQREQKMIERGELELNLARKDRYPDTVFSGGYFNQGSMPPMFQFRVDFKIPAYFWRKQRAAAAEQANLVSEARHNYEAQRQSLNFRIKDEYVNAQTSRQLMDLYSTSVIPQASLALESSRASYETGSLDFLSMLMNFMTAVDYEMNYHEEMLKFHLALARLEEMTGLHLDPTSSR
jgi:outer membrane protein TolC